MGYVFNPFTGSFDRKLDVGGTTSEISELKLSYDATNYATLATSSTADLAITTVGSGNLNSDISLIADGDLIFRPATNSIQAKDASSDLALSLTMDTAGFNLLTIFDPADDDNHTALKVGANGETTLSTDDDVGNVAHLSIKVDGDTNFHTYGNFNFRAVSDTTIASLDLDGNGFGPLFKLMSIPDQDDYCSIGVSVAGLTTIKTVDDGGAAAHLNFDIDGNVGIDNPAPGSDLEISKVSGDATLELSSWSEGMADSGTLKFQKSGTATVNTFTAGDHTTVNEVLGRIEAWGVDDNDGATLSSYIAFRNDAVSDADSSPGKIEFATSDADDAGTPTVRMTIDDGGSVGIGETGAVTPLAVSGGITMKEQGSSPSANGIDTYGMLWVSSGTDPNRLYFTNDDGDDIQLTQGDISYAEGVRADHIVEGTTSAVTIGTSANYDITFTDTNSATWLTFNTSDVLDGGNKPVVEMLVPSDKRFRLRTQGTKEDIQLVSAKGLSLSHAVADWAYSTEGTSVKKFKYTGSFTNATFEFNHTSGINNGHTTNIRNVKHNASVGDGGQIFVGCALSGSALPSQEDLLGEGLAAVTVVSITDDFQYFTINVDPVATGTNITVFFRNGLNIRPRVDYYKSLQAVLVANQTHIEAVQATDQSATGIPAQQRGSTTGSRSIIKVSTDSDGFPTISGNAFEGGTGYKAAFTDGSCDYNHTTGLNIDGSGGDSNDEDKSTIVHNADSGKIKLYMSVRGTGIPIGAYVGEIDTTGATTWFRIHLGGGTGSVDPGDRVAVTETATDGTLTFHDRVCFQDPDGSGNNYFFLEVQTTTDGLVEFGTSIPAQQAGGMVLTGAYFDMNQSNTHLVASQRLKLMSSSDHNNVIQLDAASVFLGGTGHTLHSEQDHTFVHLGDRAFIGNSACNRVNMRFDGTDALRVFQIAASNISNSYVHTTGTSTLDPSTWAGAGGFTVGVTKATEATTIDTSGNLTIDAEGEFILRNSSGTTNDISLESVDNINLTAETGQVLITTDSTVIDRDASGNDAENAVALWVDFDRSTATSGDAAHNDIGIDLDVTAASRGTSTFKGMDIDVVGTTTAGVTTAFGIDITTSGADDNIGLQITNPYGGGDAHIKLIAAADIRDYATMRLADTGDFALTTSGDGTTDSKISLIADGDILISAAGGNIALTEGLSTYTPTASNDATTKAYVDANAYHFIRAGWSQATATKSFIFVAGGEAQRDSTSLSSNSENMVFLCPYDGTVEKVIVRSETACGSSIFGMHVGTSTTEIPSTTATQSVTVDMSSTNTNYEFDFDGAGTNTFAKGNIMSFSFDPNVIPYDTHCIIVLKFDVTT